MFLCIAIFMSLLLFMYISSLFLLLGLFGTFSIERFSYCFNILSRWSSACWVSWSLRYFLAVIGVALMFLLFLLIMKPVFVSLIVWDLLLWLWLPLSATMPWVHGPPSSHLSATVDPIGKRSIIYGSTLCLIIFCLPLYKCFIMFIIIVLV